MVMIGFDTASYFISLTAQGLTSNYGNFATIKLSVRQYVSDVLSKTYELLFMVQYIIFRDIIKIL